MCHAGASIACCRFMRWCTWRRKKIVCHWSCWSPPGVPNERYGSPSRSARLGERVVEGRFPGASAPGSESSSQLICKRVLMEKPSPGTTGLEESQPPEGVADTTLPQRSRSEEHTSELQSQSK